MPPVVAAIAVAAAEASAAVATASAAVGSAFAAVGVGAATSAAIGSAVVNAGIAMGLGALSNALRGSTGGVQERIAAGAIVTRRMLVGKVWTAGSAANDAPISYDASNKRAFKVIILGDHECDGFEQIYVDGYPASLGSYTAGKGYPVLYTTDVLTSNIVKDFRVGQPKFYVEFHNGADDQVADPYMVSELTSRGLWDSTAVGKNICYLVIYAYYDSDIFSSFPTVNVFLRGAKLYNPAKDSTVGGSGSHRWGSPSTYEWSSNWAVIAYNLCRGFYVGGKLFYGCGYEPEDLPLDNWFAAIAACDEAVALKAGGTEPRYHGGCEFDVTKPVRDALKVCQDATAGEICTYGEVTFYPGVSQTAVFTFTDSDMARKTDGSAYPQSWDPYGAIDEVKNIFEGKFLDITQQFAISDLPPRYSNDDIDEDGGIPLRDTISLDQIQSGPTGQRVLEIMRKRSRAQGVAVRTFLLSALNARVGQWIAGTSADWLGTKWFSIKQFVLNADGTVTMTMREVNADLDVWVPANDELDSYAVTLPSGDPPDPLKATGVDAAPLSELGDDGSVSTGFTVTFDPVDDPTATSVVLRWRLPDSTVVHYVESTDLTSGTIAVRGLAGETTFEYSILISGIIGRTAVWSDWYTVVSGSSQQTGINDDNSASIREAFSILDSLVQSLNDTALITADNKRVLSRQIKVAQDNLSASFTEQITAEVTARQAVATLVDDLSATVGGMTADGLFAVDVEASEDGASSTIGLRALVKDAVAQALSAFLLHSEVVDGVPNSYVVVRGGHFYVQDESGNTYGAFDPTDGSLLIERIKTGGISSDIFYTPTQSGTVPSSGFSAPSNLPDTLFTLSGGDYIGFGPTAAPTNGYPINRNSASIDVEFRATYQPRTTAQVTMRGGLMAKVAGGAWVNLPESETAVPTGSNAIYQTIIVHYPIPVETYDFVMPWLKNDSGNDMWVHAFGTRVFQTSK